MKIDKGLTEKLIAKAKEKNLSPYDIHKKFEIPPVIIAKIFNGYFPDVKDDNIERIKKVIEIDIERQKENSDERLKRQLTKLLEIFKTRVNLSKQLGVGSSILTKIISGERNTTNQSLIDRTDEVYKKLEKQGFSLGDLNIDEYIKEHSYKVEDPNDASYLNIIDLTRADYKKALKNNRKLFKKLKPGGAYTIKIDKYENSLEQDTITMVVLKEYKNFYLGAERNGTKTTILKNDLYIDTTEVKKLN